MNAYDKTSIQIDRCKRILALVDDYMGKQDAATRTDLRKALMEEFEAPAIAPPVAAGSVDLHKLVIEAQERAEKAEARVKELEAEDLAMHRQLAAETLRADQGWARYEAANRAKNDLERRLVHGCDALAFLPNEVQHHSV